MRLHLVVLLREVQRPVRKHTGLVQKAVHVIQLIQRLLGDGFESFLSRTLYHGHCNDGGWVLIYGAVFDDIVMRRCI